MYILTSNNVRIIYCMVNFVIVISRDMIYIYIIIYKYKVHKLNIIYLNKYYIYAYLQACNLRAYFKNLEYINVN